MLISVWLENKLVNHENGIVVDNPDSCSFESIQNFLETYDHPLKTTAIYYQAFPGESTVEFLNTLSYELTSKLGNPRLNSSNSLAEIIGAAGLKMIIIDRSHLHPLNTLNDLLHQFAECNVCLILVGSASKIATTQILSHPTIKQWDKFTVDDECGTISNKC